MQPLGAWLGLEPVPVSGPAGWSSSFYAPCKATSQRHFAKHISTVRPPPFYWDRL